MKWKNTRSSRKTLGVAPLVSSPGRLRQRHTKRKQNWKLHPLIPLATLQCLRKVNLPVFKNKTSR